MVAVLKQCRKEIAAFPEEVRGDIADAAARLEEGQALSMPLSRPMPSLGGASMNSDFGIEPESIGLSMCFWDRVRCGFSMPSRKKRKGPPQKISKSPSDV